MMRIMWTCLFYVVLTTCWPTRVSDDDDDDDVDDDDDDGDGGLYCS